MAESTLKPEGSRERAQAVSDLFREHNRTLVRFLQSKLQNEQEAREIAQEAYVRLLELGRTGAVGFLRAYLFRIASNLAVDRLRSCRAHERLNSLWFDSVEDVIDQATVEKSVFAADEMQVFWASLDELPEHPRKAFVMNRVQGFSTSQIAAHLGKSDRMVRRYIVRALVYCRHRVEGLTAPQALERMDKEDPNHE